MKRSLAWLLALSMLLTIGGFAEEGPDVAPAPEPRLMAGPTAVPTEVPAEPIPEPVPEPPVSQSEEPAPEMTAVPEPEVPGPAVSDAPVPEATEVTAEPTPQPGDAPGSAPAEPEAAPELLLRPEWEPDAEGKALTIPVTENDETVKLEWRFDGGAALFNVQTAPVSEAGEIGGRSDWGTVAQPEFDLPVADHLDAWYVLYITAILPDGASIEAAQRFRLRLTESQPSTEAPALPDVPTLAPEQAAPPEPTAEPLPAETMAQELGMTVEELAAELGVSVEELFLMDEAALNELYTRAHADGSRKLALTETGTVTLEPGGTLQLHATLLPDDATAPGYGGGLTWSTSDAGVATVDENGLVTAVNEGTATITVEATPEDAQGTKLSGTVDVEVVRAEVQEEVPQAPSSQDMIEPILSDCEEGLHDWLYNEDGYPTKCSVCGITYCEYKGWSHEYGYDDTYWSTGVCITCGYVCPHAASDLKEGYDSRRRADNPPVPYDEDRHVIYFDVYWVSYCGECSRLIEDKGLLYENVGDARSSYANYHEFNGKGVCTVCGYKQTKCAHVNKATAYIADEDAVYTYIDNKTHSVSGNITVEEYCVDCGETLSTRVVNTTIQEQHNCWDEGVCYYCQHEVVCEHNFTRWGTSTEEDGSGNGFCVPKDSEYHQVFLDYGYIECEDCGYQVDVENRFVDEPHTFLNGSAKCVLCGYTKPEAAVPVSRITLSKAALTITKGKSKLLTASVAPKNATNKAVTWQSDRPGVATVTNGTVTAVSVGTANITCTAADGSNVSATCAVTVVAAKPTAVKINAAKTALNVGETLQLSAEFTPTDAESKLSWASSAPNIATVDKAGGLVTAKAEGVARIAVTTANGLTAKVRLTVVDPSKPTKLTLIPDTKQTLDIDKTLQLTAEVEGSESADKSVSWKSSDSTVATVSETGLVTPLKEGKVTITVKTNHVGPNGKRLSQSVVVKVNNPYKPTELALAETGTVRLDLGGTLQLHATLMPDGDTAARYNGGLKWASSDAGIATVDQSGLVTPNAKGREGVVTISVKSKLANKEGKRLSRTVNVRVVDPAKPDSLKLTPGTRQILDIDKTLQLTAEVGGSESADKGVSWKSSDSTVATVSETGLVTPLKEGKVTITVKTNHVGPNGKRLSQSVVVKVNNPYKPTKLTLAEAGTVRLNLGGTLQLHATLLPDGDTAARYNGGLKWASSDASIATVDQSGLVTPNARGREGVATISVKTKLADKDGKRLSKSVRVRVVDPTKPDSLKLTPGTKQDLDIDKTLQFVLEILPEGADKRVKWVSSDETVASVSETGLVTPHKEGKATITAKTVKVATTGTKLSQSVVVKVNNPYKPTELTLNPAEEAELPLNRTLQVEADLQPDSSYNGGLEWSSSNVNIATVDENGLVKPLKLGSVKIAATTKLPNAKGNKLTRIIRLTVVDEVQEEPEITINGGDKITIRVGDMEHFKATVTPSGTETELTWTTENDKPTELSRMPVLAMDINGNATALCLGTATVRVKTAGGLTDTIAVEVIESAGGLTQAYDYAVIEMIAQINLIRGNDRVPALGISSQLMYRAENQLEAKLDPDREFYGSSDEVVGTGSGSAAGYLTLAVYNKPEVAAIVKNPRYTNMGIAIAKTGLLGVAYVIEFE